mgnify:CR=1 FL=1
MIYQKYICKNYIKNKCEKTIIVDVESTYMHKKYKKILKKNKKFAVHDENNETKIGDRVQIIESRPISKTKSWVVTRVVEASTE